MKERLLHFYKYCFYRFYRSTEDTDFAFWSEWKAYLAMSSLLLFIVFIITILLTVAGIPGIFDKGGRDYGLQILLISFALISVFNYSLFIYNDKWKGIIEEFDTLTQVQQTRKKWLFRLVVFSIIGVLVFSYYLLSLMNAGAK